MGQWFYRIYESKRFERTIYFCIIANMLLLTLKWQGMTREEYLTIEGFNYVIVAIFLVEAVVKVVSMRRLYFRIYWNVFDFLIAIITVTTIILDLTNTVTLGSSTAVVRALRYVKVLALIKHSRGLSYIFKTFLQALKPLINIGSLLLLILYMYAIAGAIIFGQVKRRDMMTDSLNFETFLGSTLVLFVIGTTDSWSDISKSFLHKREVDYFCIENPTYEDYLAAGRHTVGCGSGFFGVVYFYSFFLLMSLILLKLFIAIIIEAYDEVKHRENKLFSPDRILDFQAAWQDFDPQASGFIRIYDLRPLLKALRGPLGFSEDEVATPQKQDQFIGSLNLPTYFEFACYSYTDVLDALALRLTVIDQVKRRRALRNTKWRTAADGGSVSSMDFEEMERDLMTEEREIRRHKVQLLSETNAIIAGETEIHAFKDIHEMVLRNAKKRDDERNQDI